MIILGNRTPPLTLRGPTPADDKLNLRKSGTSPRMDFWIDPISGGSGCPIFAALPGGELALLPAPSILAFGNGLNFHDHLTEINTAMAAIGGGHQATY